MKCPHCGSSSMGCDGSDVSCVCRDCGAVLEEGILQNELSFGEGSQNITADVNIIQNGTEASTLPDDFMKCVRSVTHRTYVCKGKQQGLNTIKEIFKHLSVGEKPLVQEAIDLYMTTSVRPHYKFQNLQKKEILAGLCVVIVCRNHDIPITLGFISKLLGVSLPAVTAAFSKFKKKCKIPVKHVNILDLVDIICGGQNEECIKFTKEVLSIVRKSWIIEGRFQNAIVMAANYFAWQALDFANRHSVTLKHYVQQQGWKPSLSLSQRFKELGQMFSSLASELPWRSHSHVDVKHVAYYLRDIVTYHRTLVKDINSEFERNVNSPDEGTALQRNDAKSIKKEVESYEPCKSKYEHIVLPTSFLKSNSKPMLVIKKEEDLLVIHPNIDSEILSEADIKEEDLSHYIKQPEEIKNTCFLSARCPVTDSSRY